MRFTASGVSPLCPFVIQGVSGAFERRQLWLHYRTGYPVGRWRPASWGQCFRRALHCRCRPSP